MEQAARCGSESEWGPQARAEEVRDERSLHGWNVDEPTSEVLSELQVLLISSEAAFLPSNPLVLLFYSGSFWPVWSSLHPLKLHLCLATMTVNSAVHTHSVCQAQRAWSWRPEKLSTPDGFPVEPPYQVGKRPGAVGQLKGTQGQSGGGRGRMEAFE